MDDLNFINNKYIDPNVYNINENPEKYLAEQEQFRRYIENKQDTIDRINFGTSKAVDESIIEHSENIINTIAERDFIINQDMRDKNMLEENNFLRFNSARYNINTDDNSYLMKLHRQKHNPQNRFVQEIKTYVNIDSRDRDLTKYPDENSYTIELGRTFTNVVSIKLVSTEIINTQQLIRETPASLQNNLIYWQIEDDEDGSGNKITYVTSLTPGNYTATTLAEEIETKMNSIERINGNLNNFTVTIDIVTDQVEFSTIDFTTLSNPFSFVVPGATATTTSIDTNFPSHGVTVGQRVFIENAETIDGINASFFNTEHIVTGVSDANTFSFEVPAIATTDASSAGGDAVQIGAGLSFKLLWSQDNTPATILGFEEEDVGFAFQITNATESFLESIETYTIDSSNDNVSLVTAFLGSTYNFSMPQGTYDFYTLSQLLEDQLDLNVTGPAFEVVPQLTELYESGHNFKISFDGGLLFPPSPDLYVSVADTFFNNLFTFENQSYNPGPNTDTTAAIDGSTIAFDYPLIAGVDTDQRLVINEIYREVSTPNIYSIVRTTLAHGLSTGDRIFIYTEDTVPSGSTIDPYTHLYGLDESSLSTSENEERLKFIAEIGNTGGLVITKLTDTTFYIPVSYVTIAPIETHKTITDPVDDYDNNGNVVIFSNITSINLIGEKYMYMCSPQLANMETASGSLVEDIFAKIQLSGDSNTAIFNSYIGNGKIYYDVPLQFLNELSFEFRTRDNILVEFSNQNHSFTLEITEAIQKIEGVGFSSKIGSST
jgi:hypothetical protein